MISLAVKGMKSVSKSTTLKQEKFVLLLTMDSRYDETVVTGVGRLRVPVGSIISEELVR